MKLKFPWQKFQMFRACMDFADMRLWERYDNMDLFVVQTPLEDPVVAAIMGAGGQEYGLSIFRGPDAFRQPHLLDKGIFAAEKINTIGFSMTYYRDMSLPEKKWIKSCNYNARKSDWLPSIISKRPGRETELVDKDHDIKLLLYILKGIMKTQKDGNFHPDTAGLTGSEMFTIEVCGDVLEPDVHTAYKSFPGSKELLELCNRADMFEAPDLLPDISNLPKRDETWVIVPIYIAISEYTDNCILVIAEEKSYYVLHADIITIDTVELVETLYGVFTGDNAAESIGIPRKIVIAEKDLFIAISNPLQEWGIDACCNENHSVAKDIRKNFKQTLLDEVRRRNKDHQDTEEMEDKGITEEALPEEFRAAAQKHIYKYYMDWLDQSIPALGNKTPRQVAKTKKGAQKVRQLIETFPDPAGNADVKIPKEEMLKALGLDGKV